VTGKSFIKKVLGNVPSFRGWGGAKWGFKMNRGREQKKKGGGGGKDQFGLKRGVSPPLKWASDKQGERGPVSAKEEKIEPKKGEEQFSNQRASGQHIAQIVPRNLFRRQQRISPKNKKKKRG